MEEEKKVEVGERRRRREGSKEESSQRRGEVPSPLSVDGSEGGTSCPPQPGGPGEEETSQVPDPVRNPVEFGRHLPGKTTPPMKNPSIKCNLNAIDNLTGK